MEKPCTIYSSPEKCWQEYKNHNTQDYIKSLQQRKGSEGWDDDCRGEGGFALEVGKGGKSEEKCRRQMDVVDKNQAGKG